MSSSTAGHTAGPWVADDGDGHYFVIAEKSTGALIAILAEPRPKPYAGMMPLPAPENPGDEYNLTLAAIHTANARLIAAAPELLATGTVMAEAALEFISIVCNDDDWEQAGNRLNDLVRDFRTIAIAAAKGSA